METSQIHCSGNIDCLASDVARKPGFYWSSARKICHLYNAKYEESLKVKSINTKQILIRSTKLAIINLTIDFGDN